ncbi:MAG: thioredoxin fold domain-containing protein [Saprospirales bacterium]|nr:thioredoxin fold domain-containing protein [Saprospirales bacterium]
MKTKLFIFLIPIFLFMQQELNGQGIRFEQTSWESVLQKASSEGKIIFMDAYAEWCGPCKKMSKDVFPDPGVSAYYNEHFINVKMDMEKGEGIALAEKYGVAAYPTLLFVDGTGELVHRAIGYHATDDFLELGSVARDQNQNLGGLEARYKKGERSPDFLYQLALAKSDAMDPMSGDVAAAYLKTQEDWATDKNREFIFRFADDLDSPQFAYILDNKEAFENQFGQEQVSGLVMNAVSGLLYEQENEAANMDRANSIFQQFDPANAGRMKLEFAMYFYQVRQMTDEYAKAAVDLYTKYPPDNWQALNEAAWTFYEIVDSPEQLKAALGWAEQSVALDKNYYNTDTLAALHYKLGNKKKALKMAKEAVKIAEASGEDASGTKKLIEDIKAL